MSRSLSMMNEAAPSLPVTGPSYSEASAPTESLTQQEAIVALGRRALADPEHNVLMHDAAELLAHALQLEYSGVAELAADGGSLRLQLDLGRDGGTAIDTPFHEAEVAGNRSLAGYAIQRARPVAVNDLREETRFEDVVLARHHIVAAMAVPLVGLRQAFGALAAYSRSARKFTPADLLFAETIAHLLTTTIVRRRAEADLDAQNRLTDRLIETVETLVLLLDMEGRLLQVNPAGEQITGFAAEEITGRKLWDVLAVPQDAPTLEKVIRKSPEQPQPTHLEAGLLTSGRQLKQVAWTFAAVSAPSGKPNLILATGIDVTSRYEAEEQVRCLEQIVAEQAAATVRGNRSANSPLVERRSRPRRPYPYHQLIAPVIDGKLPTRDQFTHIRCHDIASGGFSFSSPTPPAVDSYVVALGNPPNLTYIMAQVVHVTRIDHTRQKSYLVGCNYTGRVTY